MNTCSPDACPILDTAYYYGNTRTEETLGKILAHLTTPLKIATKANPWFANDFTNGKLGQLSAEGIEHQLNTSLTNLRRDKVDVFYLHCPDDETPIFETMEKCDELWRKEKFDHLGISNFSKDQLKEAIEISEQHGFCAPEYYQGMYNIICRKVEEVFPLLDEHRIEFWGYNPLAGGLLTGKYSDKKIIPQSRFGENPIYQNIFWKPEIINGLDDFFTPSCLEYSLQWLFHYSKIREHDKIIVGVSTIEQLESNLAIIDQIPNYDEPTVEYLNGLYGRVAEYSPNYYY
jgi:aflatoxin B1 aldehyde reductase